MRSRRRPLLALFALTLLPIVALTAGSAAGADSAAKPNFVFVLADDLEDLDLSAYPAISALKKDGATFDNFYVTDSLCCPSRATILRSQHTHNHHVLHNRVEDGGGYGAWRSHGNEDSTVATWLDAAGYRTGLVGKYFNGYAGGRTPKGWDYWAAPSTPGFYKGFDYDLDVNGRTRHYGSAAKDYVTDVLSDHAQEFVRQSGDDPFFLYLAPAAPHTPATPAPRHTDSFPNARAPRGPGWNEQIVDGPDWLAAKKPLRPKQITKYDALYRKRLQSMLGVDDMVGALVKQLRKSGELDNTYFVFTSDNGHHIGQHRLGPGKKTAFETDIKVPAVVRGPGIRPGSHISALAANVDWATTFGDLAGASVPRFVDGRSLAPLLRGDQPATWRSVLLIDHFHSAKGGGDRVPENDADEYEYWDTAAAAEEAEETSGRFKPDPPSFVGLRTEDGTYLEYVTGDREFYAARDTDQLRNTVDSLSAARKRQLSQQLANLKACTAEGCRTAEQ